MGFLSCLISIRCLILVLVFLGLLCLCIAAIPYLIIFCIKRESTKRVVRRENEISAARHASDLDFL